MESAIALNYTLNIYFKKKSGVTETFITRLGITDLTLIKVMKLQLKFVFFFVNDVLYWSYVTQ